MATLADEVRALANRKRGPAALEKIRDMITELEERAEAASRVLEDAAGLRDAAVRLQESLDGAGDHGGLLEWVPGALGALAGLLEKLPGTSDDADDDEGLPALTRHLAARCDEYESSLGDPDYSAGNRDEIWGEVLDHLAEIANWISPRAAGDG